LRERRGRDQESREKPDEHVRRQSTAPSLDDAHDG